MKSLFPVAGSSVPAPQVTPPAAFPPVSQPVGSGLVPLTEDDVKRALPANLRSAVTADLVDTLNQISTDPLHAQNIRDNFVGYSHILKDGKFKTEDYIHAVAYVSYKLMGLSNKEAYEKTFPSRIQTLVAKGASPKDMSAYVSAYAKGKLVNLILEQSLVPSWVLNQDIYQQAINVQAKLMLDEDISPKVRTDAANSLLTHLKKPEAIKGSISLDIPENSGMKELKEMMAKMADQQQAMIQQGITKTVDVAAMPLIDRSGATDVE